MEAIIISHLAGTQPARFEVIRPNGQRAPDVELPSPFEFPVQDRPNDNLMSQLCWYLEEFLDYPFPPRTEQAGHVEDALKAWGTQAFNALFQCGQARDWFIAARQEGDSRPNRGAGILPASPPRRPRDGNAQPLRLQISSDDPAILSWPWEALNDPETGVLAHQATIERRLNYNLSDPPPLSGQLPKECIHILLVTARPFESDVKYRSISRPLVDLIKKEKLPAVVELLRPPTFDQLRERLRKNPHRYHILHFDGHGAYHSDAVPGNLSEKFKPFGAEGRLVFEDKDGQAHPVSAGELSDLLREQAVPAVVLNACQSAMLDVQARDPFASVAAALLRTGIRSVVAMSYSVTVSGAQQFLPPFYRALFQTGNVAEAVRRGRQEMRAHGQRSRLDPAIKLQDWLVPVVYQQDPVEFAFASAARTAPAPATESSVPSRRRRREESLFSPSAATPATTEPEETETYPFIGRDGAFLELERALRRKPAGILIHGLGGIGKTRLARVFLRWLADTGGLGKGSFWFAFNEIRSAAHVFNEVGRVLFGPQFGAGSAQESLDRLVAIFSEQRFIIVWDNFESVRGNPGAGISAMMPEADQDLLREFLSRLRGGATKVILTSRGEEDWLGAQNCFALRLGGLRGDEVWDYAAEILDDLGLKVNRKDPELGELLRSLGGHPLAMQAVLVQLRERTPAQARDALQGLLAAQTDHTDPALNKLTACLDFTRQSLPADLQPYLVPLALHEKFADARLLQKMAAQVKPDSAAERASRLFGALTPAGLVHEVAGGVIFELHPLLTSYLRSQIIGRAQPDKVEKWTRAFVDVMGSLADAFAPKELHEQRMVFHLHKTNFHRAMQEAERLGMSQDFMALTQALAANAENMRDFTEAQRLFQRLAGSSEKLGLPEAVAGAYHQLGVIAEEQRDFTKAQQWYLKSLAIEEKQGNEHGAAITYYQLGMIAQEQRDFAQAQQWYLKSLAIEEKQGNEHGAAITYHQLGMIAQEQRDFAQAQQWYLKSLAIKEKQGNEHGAASTYHQLGMIAQEQRDFAQAQQWYLKSLAIKEKQGNEHGAAITYHQLGMIAQEQRDFAQAQQWYLKSLAIKEKQGNEHGAASTYHQLGSVAEEQRDFAQAQKWYLKSLAIKEKQGNEHGAAITYHQLGRVAEEQRDFAQAQQWYLKSLAIREKQGNEHGAASTYHQFGRIAEEQRDFAQAKQSYLKSLAIEEKQGNEHGAASTYHQLGSVAEEQRDFAQAQKWYLKSLAITEKQGNEHGAATTYCQLGTLSYLQQNHIEAGRWLIRAANGFLKSNDSHLAQQTANNFLVFLRAASADEQRQLRAMWQEAGLPPLPETKGPD